MPKITITKDMIENSYFNGCKVINEKLRVKDYVEIMTTKHKMGYGSCKDYLTVLKAMHLGECYKRNINEEALNYFIEQLLINSGVEAFNKGLTSLKKNIEYLESKNLSHKYQTKVYNDFKNVNNATNNNNEFPEGKEKENNHKSKERNSSLIKIAKKRFKEINGELYCEVCGFNFEKIYGEIGEGYIEAHHIIPISEYSEERKTKIEDLIMVCSNCHRMLHRKRPWITRKELEKLISKK